jgi:DNA-binding response OmpR family regulator
MERRILIVDDSAFASNVAATALRSVGLKVHAVDSPFHVFDAITSFKPHLVLLDLNIPGLKGENLGLMLRKRSYGFEFDVMIYSAEAETRIRDAALKVGAVGWVHKSGGPKALIKSVSDHLDKRIADASA